MEIKGSLEKYLRRHFSAILDVKKTPTDRLISSLFVCVTTRENEYVCLRNFDIMSTQRSSFETVDFTMGQSIRRVINYTLCMQVRISAINVDVYILIGGL